MKAVYIALDPLKYPRIRKIAYSLGKCNIELEVMIPKFRVVWRKGRLGRLFYAVINYVLVMLQELFVRGDIFWVANCPDILALPLVLRRKDYILEYRSPWSVEVEAEFGVSSLGRITAIIENIALTHAKIITLTTSKLVTKVKPYGKPFAVIPNYPLKSFGQKVIPKTEFRTLHETPPNAKVVLFVGKLSHVEGADMLPTIIHRVRDQVKAVFWLVGGGPLSASIKALEGKYRGAVKVFGWQPYDQIPNFINASDVCIAPRHSSIHSEFYNEEGLHKLSEYMFFKKPIVACGIADSMEYLLVDENAFGDGIVKALKGEVSASTPRTWEDCSEKRIFEMLGSLGISAL